MKERDRSRCGSVGRALVDVEYPSIDLQIPSLQIRDCWTSRLLSSDAGKAFADLA